MQNWIPNSYGDFKRKPPRKTNTGPHLLCRCHVSIWIYSAGKTQEKEKKKKIIFIQSKWFWSVN